MPAGNVIASWNLRDIFHVLRTSLKELRTYGLILR